MSVTVIPTSLARAAAAGANPRNADTCGLFDVAGRLGQAHKPTTFIIRTVDALIAAEGFPPPYPAYSAGRLHHGARRDSRWPAVAVEAWFLDRLPPTARGLVGQAERVAIDSRLATRAQALFADDAA